MVKRGKKTIQTNILTILNNCWCHKAPSLIFCSIMFNLRILKKSFQKTKPFSSCFLSFSRFVSSLLQRAATQNPSTLEISSGLRSSDLQEAPTCRTLRSNRWLQTGRFELIWKLPTLEPVQNSKISMRVLVILIMATVYGWRSWRFCQKRGSSTDKESFCWSCSCVIPFGKLVC